MSDNLPDDVFRGLGGGLSRSAYTLMDAIEGLSTIGALQAAQAGGADWEALLDEVARRGPRSLSSLAEDALRLGRAEVQMAKELAAQKSGRSM